MKTFILSTTVNAVASFRWSFGPHSAWSSIESTTILTTHPSLFEVLVENTLLYFVIKQKTVKSTDKLEYLRPFKSAADIEEEEAQAEIERSLQIGGWHSRFFTPGKKIQIFPDVAKMENNIHQSSVD